VDANAAGTAGGVRAARLVARAGFAAGHEGAPDTWRLGRLLEDGEPITVDLPAGAWPTGPWRLPPAQALVLPIAQRGHARPAGVFVAGLNRYRRFDDAYRDFLRLFVGQIASGLANARAYEEERRRAEALADLDRAKTAFFSNVSHELRTPLTLMLGPVAELLAEADDGTAAHEQLELVQRNGLRLLKMVNTMLEFSRIEAGRVQASYEPTDLAELTRDLASVFRSATERAGLRLRVECAPLARPAFVDRDMWEKIVFNLLSNAFKFTFAGEIAVVLEGVGEHIRLRVSDTGTGIPAAELPHLFERFHRVEGSRGRTHEGTGIGLALVQELVKLHGGTVVVARELDRGTTFTVTLPAGSEHLPLERLRAPAQPAGSRHASAFVEEALRWLPEEEPEPPAPVERPADQAYVLLADDNADMRHYIRRLLGARWDVEAVANGQEALEAIARRRPAVIITDVMMPVLDGFSLLRELARSDDTRSLPVIMLSARAGEESRLEALEAGATDYLVKPFAARALIARVDALILRERIRVVEEAQARRLDEIFLQAPVAIAILSGPEHVFELANPPYLALVGGRKIVGKPLLEALPELVGQGIKELLDGVRATGVPFRARSLAAQVDAGDGPRPRHFDLIYQPMLEHGEVRAIAAVAFEVTELEQARHQAELASRTKDEFLAMLGHELRNPLAPILTALQLMRLRGELGSEKERAVIERQVKHLVSMVDDLLDVSRVTRGKIELRRVPVELAEVVAQAIETASPLLEQHRHALAVDVPRGLVVDADTARLAQVIANLLTNAAKYTPDGGRVSITAQARADQVVVRVRDSGIGIAPEMLAHIFEPFTQERQALDRSQGGLGLGLAIVRSLVALHDGSVAAESEGREKGTTMTVTLPRATGERAERHATPPRGEPAARGAQRILVVDDNEDAAEMLAEILASQSYEVRCAFDGPTALDVAPDFQPDIAILDIGLPVMDGFELAGRFAAHPRLAKARLIALTGYGQREDHERSTAAGFAAHLVKPVDPELLVATIVRLTAPGSRPG
jgi:signal transduction histidine kinase